jgi:AcrR family transcriptional regulator
MEKHTLEAGRTRILKISEQLFTEHGYNAVSIRDISQACNLTNAALYYHFPSKDALYGEVIDQYAERLQQRLVKAGQIQGDTVLRLVTIVSEYVRLTADRRANMFQNEKIKTGFNKTKKINIHRKFLQAILAPIDEIIQDAAEKGEIISLSEDLSPAALLVGMIHGMLIHNNPPATDSGSPNRIQQVVEIFWRGLSAPPEAE